MSRILNLQAMDSIEEASTNFFFCSTCSGATAECEEETCGGTCGVTSVDFAN